MSVLLKCTPAQLADGVAIDHAEQEGATKEYARARRHQRAERDDPFEHAADEGVARQRDSNVERRRHRRRGEADARDSPGDLAGEAEMPLVVEEAVEPRPISPRCYTPSPRGQTEAAARGAK